MDVARWPRGLRLGARVASCESHGVVAEPLADHANEGLDGPGVSRLAERERLLRAVAARNDALSAGVRWTPVNRN